VVTGVKRGVAPTNVHLVVAKLGPGTRDRVIADLRGGRMDGAIIVHTDQNEPAAVRLIGDRPGRALGPPPDDCRSTMST